MNLGALIIASGRTRCRDDFDPLQKTGSITAVKRLLRLFSLAGCEPVVLIMGPSDALEKQVIRSGAVLLKNENPDADMFENVRIGLKYLADKCEKTLIAPVEFPFFSVRTIRALENCGKPLCVPVYQNQEGHPLLVHSQLIPAITAYSGDEGLHGAVRASCCALTQIPVDDPGIALRSVQWETHRELLEHQELEQIHPEIKVCIARERVFWGPGIRQLLSLIDHSGSVRLASQQMGMSYSKAWKMLGTLEGQLETTVVVRQQGGRHGGQAYLTDHGKEMIRRFDAFEKECREAATEIFQRHFPKI